MNPGGTSEGRPIFLPRQLTAFIGRETEVDEIGERLNTPTCRLLTLTGPGGIGKTRVALAAAAAHADSFPDGVYFVNLQPIFDPDVLVSTIADAVHIPLSGPEESLTQLCRHLADKKPLLILDNFEQLLTSAGTVLTLLQETSVTLLITSRQPLNLQEEWLFPVQGLPLNTADSAAVHLFVNRATRLQPRFNVDQELRDVLKICRLVEGMPLAIELAAAWTRTLSCADIVREIEQNLTFLTTRLRDLPDRHRSIEAIFEQTWQQLNEKERSVFARLSVFRGGFRRDAAAVIAEANLPILSSLIDKSLLRWQSNQAGEEYAGRYQIHELLRQFSEEKLRQNTTAREDTLSQHGRYYARFLANRLDDLLGGRQRAALIEIEGELDNVRAAWRWAERQLSLSLLEQMASPLQVYYWHQSASREPLTRFQHTIEIVRRVPPSLERDRLLAILLVYFGWNLTGMAKMENAREAAWESWELYQKHKLDPPPGYETDPRLLLADICWYLGETEEAAVLLEDAIVDNRKTGQLSNRHLAHRLLATVFLNQGDFRAAQREAQLAFDVALQINDHSGLAYTHDILGDIAVGRQESETAEYHYEAGLKLRQTLGFWVGTAIGLRRLGDLASNRSDYETAKEYFTKSLALFRGHFSVGGELLALLRLARTAIAQNDIDLARHYYLEAIEICEKIGHQLPEATRDLLLGSGRLLFLQGHFNSAAQVVVYCQSKMRLTTEQQQESAALLHSCEARLEKALFAAAAAHGRVINLAELLSALAAALSRPPTVAAAPADQIFQPLIDPLTPRELEVLQLIAEGHTNKQIADTLFLSVGTVKSYTSHIYSKLGVSHRTQAVAEGRKLGLIGLKSGIYQGPKTS